MNKVNKALLTLIIVILVIPLIGATAQLVMEKEAYSNSFFNIPLLVTYLWTVILALSRCLYLVLKRTS